jgi:hypothetical protein
MRGEHGKIAWEESSIPDTQRARARSEDGLQRLQREPRAPKSSIGQLAGHFLAVQQNLNFLTGAMWDCKTTTLGSGAKGSWSDRTYLGSFPSPEPCRGYKKLRDALQQDRKGCGCKCGPVTHDSFKSEMPSRTPAMSAACGQLVRWSTSESFVPFQEICTCAAVRTSSSPKLEVSRPRRHLCRVDGQGTIIPSRAVSWV